MKFLAIMVSLFCAAMLVPAVYAQSDKAQTDKKPAQADMAEMMKKWEEVSTPGASHKMLAEMVGSWETEVKNWMGGPGTEPSVTKGTAEFTMIMGGRFLRGEMKGEMMGKPFEGLGITGYDNFNKKFQSFWIDGMGTAMFTSEGTLDSDGKTITYWGSMDEPITGEKDKKVKFTETKVDAGKHLFRMYDVDVYGEKDPVMEIVYTKK